MAELEDGWLPQNEAVQEVEVDKLDFVYVKTCSDWKMLFQILRVLRSGKEGFFPDVSLHLCAAYGTKRGVRLSKFPILF
ncbi:hypothetical protein EON64_18945 [archaeon]|nr:MAG: hypothetical protein EON64_18945 [archaeon]